MEAWNAVSSAAQQVHDVLDINQTDDSDGYNAAVKTHQVIALSTLGTMILSAVLSFLPY